MTTIGLTSLIPQGTPILAAKSNEPSIWLMAVYCVDAQEANAANQVCPEHGSSSRPAANCHHHKIDKSSSRLAEVEDELADLSWSWRFTRISSAIRLTTPLPVRAKPGPRRRLIRTRQPTYGNFRSYRQRYTAPNVEIDKPLQMLVSALPGQFQG